MIQLAQSSLPSSVSQQRVSFTSAERITLSAPVRTLAARDQNLCSLSVSCLPQLCHKEGTIFKVGLWCSSFACEDNHDFKSIRGWDGCVDDWWGQSQLGRICYNGDMECWGLSRAGRQSSHDLSSSGISVGFQSFAAPLFEGSYSGTHKGSPAGTILRHLFPDGGGSCRLYKALINVFQ